MHMRRRSVSKEPRRKQIILLREATHPMTQNIMNLVETTTKLRRQLKLLQRLVPPVLLLYMKSISATEERLNEVDHIHQTIAIEDMPRQLV